MRKKFRENPLVANIYRRESDVEYRPILMSSAESRTLIAVNHFTTEKSRNKVAANKSWFTVFWKEHSIVSYYCILKVIPSGVIRFAATCMLIRPLNFYRTSTDCFKSHLFGRLGAPYGSE
jgi:hypothetical protein